MASSGSLINGLITLPSESEHCLVVKDQNFATNSELTEVLAKVAKILYNNKNLKYISYA